MKKNLAPHTLWSVTAILGLAIASGCGNEREGVELPSASPIGSAATASTPAAQTTTSPSQAAQTSPGAAAAGQVSPSVPAGTQASPSATPAASGSSSTLAAAPGWPAYEPSDAIRKEIGQAAHDSGLSTVWFPGHIPAEAGEAKVKTGPNSLMMLNYEGFTVIECPKEFKGVAFALSFSFEGKAGDEPIPIKVKFPKGEQTGLYMKKDDTYLAVVSKEMGTEDIRKLLEGMKKL